MVQISIRKQESKCHIANIAQRVIVFSTLCVGLQNKLVNESEPTTLNTCAKQIHNRGILLREQFKVTNTNL